MYEVFKQLLKRNGVTVADVSRATGINQSTFSNWKSRDNLLSGKNAQKVAEYFNVSINYLMGEPEKDRITPPYEKDAEFMGYIYRLWALPPEYKADIYKAIRHAERDVEEEKAKKEAVITA